MLNTSFFKCLVFTNLCVDSDSKSTWSKVTFAEFIIYSSNPNPSLDLAFCHSDPAIRSTSDFLAGDPTILNSAEPAVSSVADDPPAPPEGQWTERQGRVPVLPTYTHNKRWTTQVSWVAIVQSHALRQNPFTLLTDMHYAYLSKRTGNICTIIYK